ncbi:MAG TPA: hypothetical protein VFQ45_17470, partial [Longimicrobium sp.]|nr:hypothetical protein [Longimicrobium sp.]
LGEGLVDASEGSGGGAAFLAVPEVFSAFHPLEITQDTGTVVDDAVMLEVEDALRTFFGL